jgi:hypothetical protein
VRKCLSPSRSRNLYGGGDAEANEWAGDFYLRKDRDST